MIDRYNRNQTLLAALNVVLGLVAFVLAFFFFYLSTRFLVGAFGLGLPGWATLAIAGGVVLIIAISGFVRARAGEGHSGMEDSDLSLGILGSETGGSHAVGYYGRQVTGPAYVLSQIFLGGPLQISRALGRLRSRIPGEHGLEGTLQSLLSEMQATGKWQDAKDFAGRERGLSYLIRMGEVEFSQRRGRVRAATES